MWNRRFRLFIGTLGPAACFNPPQTLLHPESKLEGHSSNVDSAAFSPDSQHIVTAIQDATARIFQIVTLDDIARLLASK
jgi:WD40 repeat protein